ncbi:hypothetical protein [Streptomyces sp. NPDC088358]|uniref:hypothetical protein n=1 Tax=Streptomyces sp. NPDC088358 TaxID=3365857 RepID=UPI003822B259
MPTHRAAICDTRRLLSTHPGNLPSDLAIGHLIEKRWQFTPVVVCARAWGDLGGHGSMHEVAELIRRSVPFHLEIRSSSQSRIFLHGIHV